MTTQPKRGGYNWQHTLEDMRCENADMVQRIATLKRAARTAETRVLLLELETAVLRNNERIAELRAMEER